MLRFAAIGAATVVAAGLAATWYVSQSGSNQPFAQCRATNIAGGAQIGGPFELLNARAEVVTDADVITEPSLIYFGYTFCPDVCPLDVSRNAVVTDLLAERGISITPIFISVDPARDTPEIVGDFAFNLHEKMIGLTGSPEQIAAASAAYKTYYKAHDGDPDYYLVDHSTFSYLVLPEHGFVEFYRRDLTEQQVADSIACFTDHA